VTSYLVIDLTLGTVKKVASNIASAILRRLCHAI